MSNLNKTFRSICAESIIIEAMRVDERIVAVNLDVDLWLSCTQPRNTKDDSISHYGKTIGTTEAPVLNRDSFKEFLKDASRHKNVSLTKDRSLLVFLDKSPEKSILPVLDAFCLIVSSAPSSIPFIFSIIKSQHETGCHVPIKIVVAGELAIEKAAEFFLTIRTELESLRGNGPEFSFIGNIHFNQDQFELATGNNQTFIDAFPGGSSHGQIKYIVSRLLQRDATRTSIQEDMQLNQLSQL
jgi:hypothetical protein